jgi:hypothetical protein
MEEQKDRDYQKEYQNQKAYVISLNCTVVGVWRNLKKLCVDMKEKDKEFPSYWTLTRKRDEAPIKFITKIGEYSFSIEKLK